MTTLYEFRICARPLTATWPRRRLNALRRFCARVKQDRGGISQASDAQDFGKIWWLAETSSAVPRSLILRYSASVLNAVCRQAAERVPPVATSSVAVSKRASQQQASFPTASWLCL
eukprot:498771-Pyramimonas_sp.AAC.1